MVTPNTAYQLLGGEPVVRAMVRRFYELMDTLPETHGIRQLHPADLSASEEKLYLFLTGWLGGPQLYIQKHGQPQLRARHLPFPIGNSERDQWMLCMHKAMEEHIVDLALRESLTKALADLADFMRNQPNSP
jgi:hemoglobin